ncbi:MAG: hypothetical protein GXP19_07720 [Gammaproteobacteria bacterium]|nr:hypothetical protein [Gammaproteobacteria bacterium]
MALKRKSSPLNIHESFSDVALLMLATFIFLLVTILITSKFSESHQLPKLQKDLAQLQKDLTQFKDENAKLKSNMEQIVGMSPDSQMEQALAAAGLGQGKNRKDFELFIKGLKNLPGDNLHLMVDATGSMHGVTTFLIPVLRVIVIRSGKRLNAITWFSDDKSETYMGKMGEMFDQLMRGAPFIGYRETMGRAFTSAISKAPAPGAYLLIGDEPSTDKLPYLSIPSPVYTLPIGYGNTQTDWEYETLAKKTGGKMLHLEFK